MPPACETNHEDSVKPMESAAAVDEPGDGAFDHGPVLPVGDVESAGLGEGPGGDEQAVVGVQRDDAPAGGGGAALPLGAGAVVAAEAGVSEPVRAIRRAIYSAILGAFSGSGCGHAAR
jgi:hypothetical protein